MSGGEQAMLAVSRALMSQPRLILVDEASAGLAPIMVRQLFDLEDFQPNPQLQRFEAINELNR